jgi:hypothetical protein
LERFFGMIIGRATLHVANSPVLKHVKPDASSTEPTIGEVVLSGSQVD